MKQKLLLTLILWLTLLGSTWAQGNALHFDGSNDYVDLPDFTTTHDFSKGFTFAAWIKWDAFTGNARVFEIGNGSSSMDNSIILRINGSGVLVLQCSNGTTNSEIVTNAAVVTTGTWHHVGTTISSAGAATIYVDGTAVKSGSVSAPKNVTRANNWLGKSAWSVDNYFNGTMDEVSIWHKALTQADIEAIKQTSPTGNEDKLAAYYNFNQATGTTLTDATTNAKNGTLKDFALSGTTSNWVEGYTPTAPPAPNNALHFNGNTDYIQCPAMNPATFTVEAWVYPTLLSRDQAIISTLSTSYNTGMELHLASDDKPLVTIRNAGGWLDVKATSAIAPNTWAHLAATYNGSTVKLYVNGVEAATAAAVSYTPGSRILDIGRRPDGEETRFAGRIDEVRIWDIARTQTEIANAKDNPLAGTESNLLAYYNFNQGTANGHNASITHLTDATTNAKHGELYGFGLNNDHSNFVEGFVAGTAPTYHLSATPNSLMLSAANGSNGTITVTSNTNWEASLIFGAGTPWATVSPTSGSGNGSITITANSANTGTSGRGALLRLSGDDVESVNINLGQNAPVQTTLTYTLTDGTSHAVTGNSLAGIFMSANLNEIKTITVTGGDFTTDDWNYLKNNRNNLIELTAFTIASTVNSAADVISAVADNPVFKMDCKLEELYLAKVKKVGFLAFNQINALKTVILPDATEIEWSAFWNCINLVKVSIPKISTLGIESFRRCTQLTNMLLPAMPPTVGKDVFTYCPSPRYITYADANGNMITDGNAWTTAYNAYKGVSDGNSNDELWYGWAINRRLYNVTVATPSNGTLTAGNPEAMVFGAYPAGATINVTATPNSNYWLSSLKFTKEGVAGETVITGGAFTMPEGNVTVSATFLSKLFAGPSTFSLNKTEGSIFKVDIISEKNWTIEGTLPSWLIASQLSGNGGTTEVTFTATEDNTWAFDRETITLTLKSEGADDVPLTVTQEAATPKTTFSARYVVLDWQQGSTASIEIQSNEKWSVTSILPSEFLSIEPQAGQGNATLTITALKDNNSGMTQGGAIKLNNLYEINVDQKFNAKPLDISARRIRLAADKDSTVQVQVITDTDWELDAYEGIPDWLSVSPMAGKGNATITFTARRSLTEMMNNLAGMRLTGNEAYPVFLMVEQAAEQMPQGKGTKEEPYLISSVDNLMWMSVNTASNFYNRQEAHYQLTGDIDARASHAMQGGFPGIPHYYSRERFNGSFNGKGYAIKNFLSTTGLFTATTGAALIDSLALVNVTVQGSDIGGLVTRNNGTINACYVTGLAMGMDCGLIANINEGSITNCYAAGRLEGRVSGIMNNGKNVEHCYAVTAGIPDLSYAFNNTGPENVNGYYNSDIFRTGVASPSADVKGLSTNEMAQQANFTGWDFEKMWSITEDESFPRIKGVYNYPLLSPTYNTTAEIGELYQTTIVPISMDGAILEFTLTDAPEGMTLEGNTISWTPTSGGLYHITVTITDDNSRTVDYTIPISVMLMGEGTANDPYLIHTIGELNTMRYMEPNAHFRLMNDLDFAGTEFSKESGGQGWLPLSFGGDMLGMPQMPFQGYFHGGGHNIKNLYTNYPNSIGIGLFQSVEQGTINSLGLENVHIEGYGDVGALCGRMLQGQITACHVTGTVRGFQHVGGLVGEAANNSNLTRCYANVSVLGTSRIENEREVTGRAFGALAGRFNDGTITNCYAAGSVTGAWMAGGMCGSLTQTAITHSYTTAVGRNADGLYYGIASFNDYNSVTNTYCYQPTFAGEFYAADGVTAINLVQIKEQATYADWDFTNTWEITDGQTLPRLRGMKNFPVLLPVKDVAQVNVEYVGNLNMIQMGSPVGKFSISGVEGMTFAEENSSVVLWTPATAEQHTLTVHIAAQNGDSIAIATSMEVIPFAGEGTLDNPYQITTIAQLDAVRRYPNKHFKLMNDLDFNGSPYSKENSRYGWDPIADFSGSLDGNGHLIKNLYINIPENGDVKGAGVGLFATITKVSIASSMVKNLGLVNVDIRNNNNAYNTGAICGTINGEGDIYTSIHHCYVTGTVYGNDQNTGGIVGSIEDRATVSHCYSHATVTTPGNQPGGALGGIAGYNSNGNIYSCYATGMVMLKNMATPAVGGTICGMNYGANAIINNCYFTQRQGSIVGSNSSGAQAENNQYLNREQAKKQASYIGWDFGATEWAIAEGEGMPALIIMSNNAPAAFDAGDMEVGSRIGMDRLLPFGYDHETARQKMVVKPIDWDEQLHSDGRTYVAIKPGQGLVYNATVTFQVGEVVAPGDTIWGGTATVDLQRPSGTNSTPTTAQGNVTITEDSNLEGYNALALASDPDDDYLTIARIAKGFPLHGTATIANNRITYQPNADYNGTDEIRYVLTDGDFEVEGLINVTITAVNDAPVLTAVSEKSVNEDNSLTLTLNDVTATDVDGDALSLVIASGDNYTVNDNTITPAENFHGTLSVGIAVTDGTLTSNQMVMEITVVSVNDIPVLTAVADLTMNEDESITITMDDVTATDADGDELQIVIDQGASGGEKSSAGAKGQNYTVSGTTITPAKDFHGELKVNVGVRDKFAGTPQMVMTITVLPINDAPVLNAVSTHVLPEDESIPLSMYDVAATDVDNAQNELLLIVYEGENYTVNGTTVTPAENYHGTLNVPLAVSDGELTSNQMVMVITINSVNDAPVLTAVSYIEMFEDESITLTLADVTATDAEGDLLQLVIANGENYTVNGNTITPDADFHGTLNVPLAVSDGELTSNLMAMEITVHNVYDAPVLHAVVNKTINEDGMLELTINDVTATWVDDNIENLLVVIANCEPHSVAGNTLIPVQDFNGTIEISVALFDGSNYSNYVTSTLTVLSVNDEPVLIAVASKSIKEGETLTLTMADVTASDADGDALSLFIANGENYTVSGNTITPASGFTGTLSVGISVSDGELTSNQMVMSVTVTALEVNSAPVLTAVASKSIKEGETLTLTMADVTASDADGDALTLVIANGNNYTVSGNTITPATGFTGTVSVGISVTDGELTSNQMVMSVTVTALDVNSAPVLTAVTSKSIKEGETLTLTMDDVTASDAEGDALTLVIANGNNYTVSGNTITPASGFTGTLSVGISVSDGELTSNQMVMSVTVTALDVNSAPILTAVTSKSIKEGETLTITMDDVTATDAEGDALTLVIANGNNYTVSGNTITPATGFTGTLSVGIAVTDGELTSNQMVMTVTVTPATGIDDNHTATVSAYPNPFTDYVVIESEEQIRSVSFINLLGKTVQHVSMPQAQISTQNLLPGIYLVKVDFAKGKPVVVRMVKQ